MEQDACHLFAKNDGHDSVSRVPERSFDDNFSIYLLPKVGLNRSSLALKSGWILPMPKDAYYRVNKKDEKQYEY